MTPPILITIESGHPVYAALLESLESLESPYRRFLMLEQHADGTWSASLASVLARMSLSPSNYCSVQTGDVKP